VNYDSRNTFGVLTQMRGSVWPKVLPYCVANTALTYAIHWLKNEGRVDLTFPDSGHRTMAAILSFLVVTRSNIAYARYWEARTELSRAMKSCRELVQHAITFSRFDASPGAQQWRSDVARRTIVLLRTVVSVLEYQTSGQHAWKVPELTKDEKQALLSAVGKSNERAPMVLAMFLRSTIASHVEHLEDPFHVNKELRLFKFVSDFIAAYHDLTKLVTTPFPFPLVQMSRTFVLIWVFSLPLSLVYDMETLPALLFLIFFVTFGFVGLEFVAVEFDDPFGDDPNDFDCLGLARVVFEDLYICIYDIDGQHAADTLRRGVEAKTVHRQGIKTKSLSSAAATKKTSRAGRHKRHCSFDAFHNSVAAPRHTVGADRSRLLLDASSRLNQDMTLSHFVQQQQQQTSSLAISPANASITRTETPSSGESHSQMSLDIAAVFAADSPTGGAFRFDSPNSTASGSPGRVPTPTYGATGTSGRARTSSREGLPPRPQDCTKQKRRSTSNESAVSS
jgi:putative membrane protein